jgi:hypothetical protein
LLGVAVAYAWRAQTRRVAVMRRAEALGEAAREAKVGPIPGYSYLPGSAIRWDPRDPPPRGLGERWRVLSVETLHLFGPRGLRRARLVLRIAHEALEDTDLVQLARELATGTADESPGRRGPGRIAALRRRRGGVDIRPRRPGMDRDERRRRAVDTHTRARGFSAVGATTSSSSTGSTTSTGSSSSP